MRAWVQLITAVVWNPFFDHFINGRLYRGSFKQICIPALNCYSCPGAAGACPLGSLQTILADPFYNWSLYVLGWLVLFGSLMGRWICGWICPFGMLQEWLYRIPLFKLKLPRWMRWIKYAVLAVFVILIPVLWVDAVGLGESAFCKYICPAGTLEAGIPLLMINPGLRAALGGLFIFKAALLVLVVVTSVMVFRPFCRVLCPLGAVYGLFNPVSWYRYEFNRDRCISCTACERSCRMDIQPAQQPNSPECIRCGDCIRGCEKGALRAVFGVDSTTEQAVNE